MQESKIVGVKFESKYNQKTFEGREYSYYTDIDLEVNDIVEVETRSGKVIALVTKLDVPESEIEKIKQYMKTITKKLDKEEYLNGNINNRETNI